MLPTTLGLKLHSDKELVTLARSLDDIGAGHGYDEKILKEALYSLERMRHRLAEAQDTVIAHLVGSNTASGHDLQRVAEIFHGFGD